MGDYVPGAHDDRDLKLTYGEEPGQVDLIQLGMSRRSKKSSRSSKSKKSSKSSKSGNCDKKITISADGTQWYPYENEMFKDLLGDGECNAASKSKACSKKSKKSKGKKASKKKPSKKEPTEKTRRRRAAN